MLIGRRERSPFETVLTIKCASGVQTLKNYNFPAQHAFDYSPSVCGETTLEIKVQDMKLNVPYSGQDGFIHFLSSFAQGSHRFMPSDFPQYQQALVDLGIKWIDLEYKFADLRDPLQHLRRLIALKKIMAESKQQQQLLQQQQRQMAAQDIQGKIDDLDSTPNFSSDLPTQAALCWPNPQAQAQPLQASSDHAGVIRHQ